MQPVESQKAGKQAKKLAETVDRARKNTYKAQKLERELSHQQVKLLKDLQCGVLEKNKRQANEAYGHGDDIKVISREQAAVVRMSMNQLERMRIRGISKWVSRIRRNL